MHIYNMSVRPQFLYFLVLGTANPIFSKFKMKIKVLVPNFIFFIPADRTFSVRYEIKIRTLHTCFVYLYTGAKRTGNCPGYLPGAFQKFLSNKDRYQQAFL